MAADRVECFVGSNLRRRMCARWNNARLCPAFEMTVGDA
jgi:hypothetical protein